MESVDTGSDSGGADAPVARRNAGTLQSFGVKGGGAKVPPGMSSSKKKNDKAQGKVSRPVFLHTSQKEAGRFATAHGADVVYLDTAEINAHVFGQVLRTLLENNCLSRLRRLIKSGEIERVVVLWPRETEISIYADNLSGLRPKTSVVRGCRPCLKGVDASERRKVIPVEYVKAPTHFVVHDVYDVGPAELYRTCVQCAGMPAKGSSHKVTMMIYDFGTPGDFEELDEDSMFIQKFRVPKDDENDECFVVEAVATKRIRKVGEEWVTIINHHSRPGAIYEASDNSYPDHSWFEEYLYYSVYYGFDQDVGWFRMTSHVETSKGPKVSINLAFEPMCGIQVADGDFYGIRRPEWIDVRSNRLFPTPFHRNWVNGPVFALAREAAMDIPASLKSYVYSTFTNKVRQQMDFRYETEKHILDKFLMPPIAPGLPGLSVWSEVLTKTVGYGLSHPLKLFPGAPPGVSGFAELAEKAAAARIQSIVPMPDGLAAALSHSADKQTWFDAGLLAARIIKELAKAAWDGLRRVFDFLVQCLPNAKISGLSLVTNAGKLWKKAKNVPGVIKGFVNKAMKTIAGPVTRSVVYKDFVDWLKAHPVVDAVLGCIQTALTQLVEAAAEEIVKRILPLRVFALILAVAEAVVCAMDADTDELKVFFFNWVWRSVAHVLLALMPFPVAVAVHFLFNMARYIRDVWRGQERMHLSASLDEFLISESGPLNEVEMQAMDCDFEIVDSEIVAPPTTTMFGEDVESSAVLAERAPEAYKLGGSVAVISSSCTDAFGKPVNDLRTFLGILKDRFDVKPPDEIEESIVRDYALFERMMGDKMRPVTPMNLAELREYVEAMPFSTGKKEMYYERIARLEAGGPVIVGMVQMGIKTDEKLPFKHLPSGLWMKCRPLFPMDEVGLWAMCWILAFKKQFDHPFVWNAPWGQFSMHYSVSPTQKNLNSWFSTFRCTKGVHIIIHGDDNFIMFSNGSDVWVAAYDLKSCDLTCGPVHQAVHRDFFRRYGMSEEGVEGMRERAHAVRGFEEWVEGVRVLHKFRMRPSTDTGRPTTSFDAALMQMPMWCRLFHIIKDSGRQVGGEFARLVCEMFSNLATRHGVMLEWEEDLHSNKVGPLSTRSFLGGIFCETPEGGVWSPLTGVKGTCFVRDPRDVYPTKDLKEALWIALKATVSDQVARINPVTELICAHYTRWMGDLPRPDEAVLQKALKAYRHNMNVYDLSRLEEDDVVKVDMDSFVLALSQYNSCRGFPDPWESLSKLYEALDTANDVFVRVEADMSPLWFNARWGKLKSGPWVREERKPLFGALNIWRLLSGSNKQTFDKNESNITIDFVGKENLFQNMNGGTEKSIPILPPLNNYSGSKGKGEAVKQRKKKPQSAKGAKQAQKTKKPTTKEEHAKCLMSKESLAKHIEMVKYLRACKNPKIRGQLAVNASNPLPTTNATPYYAEALARFQVTPGNTLFISFPLGCSVAYEAAGGAMDGVSFHQQFLGVGATPDTAIWGTGILGTFLGDGSTANPAAMIWSNNGGYETLPISHGTAASAVIPWDGVNSAFPIMADVRPSVRKHLRQALISAGIHFCNETPIQARGGLFYTWEPIDLQSPVATTSASITGSLVRELPSFKVWQSDERMHQYTVVGNKLVRSYCHDEAPSTGKPTVAAGNLSTNNKTGGLNLMFVNTTAAGQTVMIKLDTNWSVGGEALTSLSQPVPILGESASIAKQALADSNVSGSIAGVVKSAVNAVMDPGARSVLNKVGAAVPSVFAGLGAVGSMFM